MGESNVSIGLGSTGTKISWAHATFNPIWGCTRVSPGCQNCYAESFSHRLGLDVWGKNAGRRTFGDAHWAQPLKWNRKAQREGSRYRVFCASMADVFEDHPIWPEQRERLWNLIEATPHLDWMLLTKRPENILGMLPLRWSPCPENIWMGVTAENQEWADKRIPYLLDVDAAVRFISYEPALGPLDVDLDGIDLVIAGGESGPKARPPHPGWFQAMRDRCIETGTAYHLKQWGQWGELPLGWPAPGSGSNQSRAHAVAYDGRHWPVKELAIRYLDADDGRQDPFNRPFEHVHETGRTLARGNVGDLRLTVMHRVGVKESGRELDDKIWDEMPTPRVRTP